MAQIIATLIRLLALANQILSLVTGVRDAQTQSAREHAPFALETIASNAELELVNPNHGLAKIESDIQTALTLLNAIHADYQQRTQPVTLPSVIPSEWSADISASSADAIWRYNMTDLNQYPWIGFALYSMFLYDGYDRQNLYYPLQARPAFELSFAGNPTSDVPYGDILLLPASLAGAPSDGDLVPWLNVNTPFTWSYLVPFTTDLTDYATTLIGGGTWPVRCRWTRQQLAQMLAPSVQGGTAPIWPGLANVQLGTPVVLAPPGQTVNGPMDGVLVSLTAWPPYKGQFVFGPDVSLRNIGAIAFKSDNGDDEYPQLLGFTNAVYVPRTMARANACVVRIQPGVSGTITPWTRTP